jgi:Flp pilus assembly protein TadG
MRSEMRRTAAARAGPGSRHPRPAHHPPRRGVATTKNRRRSGDGAPDRGAAAVEFALLLPVLLLLVFGLIDMGRALNAQITLTQAAREGARLAALSEANVVSRTQAAAVGLSGVTVTVTACPSGDAGTSDATVQVSYPFTFITPLGAIGKLVGGSGPGSSLTLTATGVMACD